VTLSRNTLILFLLLIAFGLSSWSIIITRQTSKVITQHSPDQPDAFMENIASTVFNKTGTPSLKVSAPKMVHYEENDVTELTTPHVIVYRKSPEPWHIDADYARATGGINQITFWNNVVIHHLADTQDPITTMTTSSLTIVPDEKIAKTDDAVVMTQPDTTVHAVGMLANWEAGTVKLLSQAREEYVPQS